MPLTGRHRMPNRAGPRTARADRAASGLWYCDGARLAEAAPPVRMNALTQYPDTQNHIGIGCRPGVSAAQIDAAVRGAVDHALFAGSIAIATIDARANEPGLIAFCEHSGLPLRAFTVAALRRIESQWHAGTTDTAAAPSAVMARFGLRGVCEPAALLSACYGGTGDCGDEASQAAAEAHFLAQDKSRLLLRVPKYTLDGVTVALAVAIAPGPCAVQARNIRGKM